MSATTHHRRLRKPSGSLSSGSLDGLPEGGLASILVAEYDRKISLLTTQLEEKVEQNITLQQQADTDLGLILDLQDENKKLLSLLEEEKSLASEFQRRNESMAVGLNMMASEILQLRGIIDEKDGKGKAKATASLGVVDSEQEMIMMQKISDLTHEVKKLKKKYHQTKENEESLQENCDMYEEELRSKKKSWKDMIQKEAKRRKIAENEARRLKAKVEELEFLLDQRQSSDDFTSSDDESGDEAPSDTVPEKPAPETQQVETDVKLNGPLEETKTKSSESKEDKETPERLPDSEGNSTEAVSPTSEASPNIKHIRSPPKVRRASKDASNEKSSSGSVVAESSEGPTKEEASPPPDMASPSKKESFEARIKKRLEDRNAIIEERNQRRPLEDDWERSLRHSASAGAERKVTVQTPQTSATPTAAFDSAPPTSALDPSSTSPGSDSKSPQPSSKDKKVNFFDKIAAVFKPPSGSS